ncbi:MAG: GNAT family N-acetyltransferase [Flavobacteriales bacterium]|nr:GNAT family N-acetyltransferase [Flavobacteriales bacterium]|tara:strand:- start:54 stop:539 length:486 start_codon:yes stop_codon:yes gene_type:complete
MTAHIRKGTQADLPVVLDLIKELAEYEKALNEVTITLKELEKDGFGEHPWYWFIVAEIDDEIVGMSFYFIRYSTWKGRFLFLEDFVVKESYRGKGIGSQLFEETVRIAQQIEVNGMIWQVLDWNEPAINFYKKYDAHLDDEWLSGKLVKKQITNFRFNDSL